jgi:bisphosphoglycerate-independent phosphoglycerate mutase (AlkP superfamily)
MSSKNADKKSIIKELNRKLYEINKEKIKENSARYYAANKEELNRRIKCKCGLTYTKKNKSIHIKTKVHKAYFKGVNDGIKKAQNNSSDSESTDTSSSDDSDSDSDSNTKTKKKSNSGKESKKISKKSNSKTTNSE